MGFTCDIHPTYPSLWTEAFFLKLRSIWLHYKHTDLPNREYSMHDEDSSWQEHFALWLIWAAKL